MYPNLFQLLNCTEKWIHVEGGGWSKEEIVAEATCGLHPYWSFEILNLKF